MRRVAIAGIGYTKIGELWERSLRDLFVEAALKAMDDAGVDKVEALYVGNMMSGSLQEQEHLGALLASHIGRPGIMATKVEAACASGGMSLHQAYLAVASGLYDMVIAGGVEKMTDKLTPDVTLSLAMADDREYVVYSGATFVGLNALIYRYYMHKFDVKQEDIASFAVYMHENACNTPYAQYRNPIKLEDILRSPFIADPIHLLECAPISDGAAALVITTLDRAKKLTDTPVEIIASSAATDYLSIHERDDILTLRATVVASKEAYGQAKLEPKDIDLLEVHDAFTILGVLALEDLGFAKKGEGYLLVREGEIARDGKIPVNTMGGLKARGHPVGATGIFQVIDATLQLRGEAGKNQISKAETALLQSTGGVGGTVVIHILKRRD